jgi:hypothetical protein
MKMDTVYIFRTASLSYYLAFCTLLAEIKCKVRVVLSKCPKDWFQPVLQSKEAKSLLSKYIQC